MAKVCAFLYMQNLSVRCAKIFNRNTEGLSETGFVGVRQMLFAVSNPRAISRAKSCFFLKLASVKMPASNYAIDVLKKDFCFDVHCVYLAEIRMKTGSSSNSDPIIKP